MIQITNISKSFDDIKAVDDITVDIGEQIVFGLLGTNGAGKSTLLRMVSGILKPDSGNITVDDMGVLDNEEAICFSFLIHRIFSQTAILWI